MKIQIQKLDPDDFRAAYEYALMVSENEMMEEIPAIKRTVKIDAYGGEPAQEIQFPNSSFNRFMFAALRSFESRKEEGNAFMSRVFAMQDMIRKRAGSEDIVEHPNGYEISPSFMAAVATTPLVISNWQHKFRDADFQSELDRIKADPDQ